MSGNQNSPRARRLHRRSPGAELRAALLVVLAAVVLVGTESLAAHVPALGVDDVEIDPTLGSAGDRGNVRLELDLRPKKNVHMNLFLQVFAGYGESLVDYDQRQTSVWIGARFGRW